jgi:hypothetical protein
LLIGAWIACSDADQIFVTYDQFFDVEGFHHDKGTKYPIVKVREVGGILNTCSRNHM